jgi:lipoate-protein ligase A
MTAAPFRVIDTGLRNATDNVAFDQALIDARLAGSIPDTIRFLRFPKSALVGVNQVLPHEVRLGYCRRNDIQVARRITGGGALYMDPRQLGWELVFDRRSFPELAGAGLQTVTEKICRAAAIGLRHLGVDAQFRPRNDIEVDGRKLVGTGGVHDGPVIFFQGTLLIDFDPTDMISALKVPAHKLAKRDIREARDRVTCLKELLGAQMPEVGLIKNALLSGFAEGLGLRFESGAVTVGEEALALDLKESEFDRDDFIDGIVVPEAGETALSATLNLAAGVVRADVRVPDARRRRIQEVILTGDFLATPARGIVDLEAALKGARREQVDAIVQQHFAAGRLDCQNLAPEDFSRAIEMAFRQLSIQSGGNRLRGHIIGSVQPDRPTLIFLHDALGCARFWRDFPHRLSVATGLPALIYDRLGSGDSDPLQQPFSTSYIREEALQSLPDVLRAAGVERAILVGHSDGATMALTFAGAAPGKIDKVIAIAPHLYREARTLAEVRERVFEFEHGDLKARLRRYHGSKTDILFERLVETWTNIESPDWGVDADIAAIACPVLALQGDTDEYFSIAQLDAIEDLIGGRLTRLILRECGHVPHLTAADEALAAMERFIRS